MKELYKIAKHDEEFKTLFESTENTKVFKWWMSETDKFVVTTIYGGYILHKHKQCPFKYYEIN